MPAMNILSLMTCWSLRERDKDGNLVADPKKFPNGMKSCRRLYPRKRIKIWYVFLRRIPHTCAGYPGSFEHEFQDAATFAGWDVDYLKYDYCFKPRHMVRRTFVQTNESCSEKLRSRHPFFRLQLGRRRCPPLDP